MISEEDVQRLAVAARELPPAEGASIENDFVLNLLETVLDYMLQTAVVVKALEYYKAHRWDEIRTLDELEVVLERFGADQEGNTALALHLWGYKLWTRAGQLRGLARYFRATGVTDRDTLRRWAATSTFENDFEGKVKGLGRAVYQALVMRQGVDTVKPDVHVRRVRPGGRRSPAERPGGDRGHDRGGQAARPQRDGARLANLGGVSRRGSLPDRARLTA